MSQDPAMHGGADVHSDIAYMKKLAEEGRQAPVLVGPILVSASLWFGAATFIQWMGKLGILPIEGWGLFALWMIAGAGFGVVLFMLIRKLDTVAGSGTRDNVAIGAAWSACGFSIFGTWMVLTAFALSTGSWSSMALMPAVVMIAYGAAWIIAGQIVRQGWMIGVGVISFAGAVALGWFAFTDWTYAIYLVLLVAVALCPGLYLMKQASRAGG